MKKLNLSGIMIAIAIMFLAGSCNKNHDKSFTKPGHPENLTEDMMSENGANPDEASITENLNSASSGSTDAFGAYGHYLYTESNESEGNRILVYQINYNGSLDDKGSTTSGGKGTGSPLGSQGAVVIDKDHDWLFAVNAGSNSVSSFKIKNNGSLQLAYTESTQGTTPVSVALYGNKLYVLNRGSDNIHGFWVGNDGKLTHINGSTQPLSSSAVDAPQISFSPDGDWIIVTEKATNIVGTFRVNNNGGINAGRFNPSVGNTPFGFEFARNHFMIVSNAEGGAAGAGTGTSYIIGNNGKTYDINGARPNYQAAPCWVATTKHGRFAYMTNTASNNISSYYVAPWGGLYLIEGSAADAGMGPLDIVVAANNYFVYAINAGSHSITRYYRKFFGGLDLKGSTTGLPAGTTGLATF